MRNHTSNLSLVERVERLEESVISENSNFRVGSTALVLAGPFSGQRIRISSIDDDIVRGVVSGARGSQSGLQTFYPTFRQPK